MSPGTLRAEAVGRLSDLRDRGLRPAQRLAVGVSSVPPVALKTVCGKASALVRHGRVEDGSGRTGPPQQRLRDLVGQRQLLNHLLQRQPKQRVGDRQQPGREQLVAADVRVSGCRGSRTSEHG